MSTRVVSKTHTFGDDDYVLVPSSDEFDGLSKRLVSAVRIITSQGEKIHDTASRISSVVEKLDNLKSDIESELTNGAWKATLVETTKELCADIEIKLHEINEAIAAQMSDLVKQEMAARSLADDLAMTKEEATKEIAGVCDAARNEIASLVATAHEGSNGKVLELCEQKEGIADASGNYEILQKQADEAFSRIAEMEAALETAKNELAALSERLNHGKKDLEEKAEVSALCPSQREELCRKIKISTIFAILALIMSVVCLCVK